VPGSAARCDQTRPARSFPQLVVIPGDGRLPYGRRGAAVRTSTTSMDPFAESATDLYHIQMSARKPRVTLPTTARTA